MTRKAADLYQLIQNEKALLTANEIVILAEIKERHLNDKVLINSISDQQYNIMTDDEKALNNSRKRIDYIICKEIEYCIITKKIPRRVYDYLHTNAKKIVSNPTFAPILVIFAYYLDNKNAIDVIVSKIVSGILKHQNDSFPKRLEMNDLFKLTPEALLTSHSDIKQLVVEFSIDKITILDE